MSTTTSELTDIPNAASQGGNISRHGEIRLHWRVTQAPPPQIIHYVVAHELAHLKEMNHSPKFWAWVEKLCPDHIQTRQDLKARSSELHLM